MSTLAKLKAAATLEDVAKILGYKPNALSYLLYVLPVATKYHTFTVPKKSGGVRTINAPEPRLKALQKHLANALYACSAEIKKSDETERRSLSHGFKKRHSIATNAEVHKGRRFVLNLDLEDFFPSFNFGRVRGFFMKNNHFLLHEKAATVIAQIASHDNQLPQGSPCSPVISDLITHILDVKLAQLAKLHRCSYSRYADDITFSTNQKSFPEGIAAKDEEDAWQLSAALLGAIGHAGFKVNPKKTRMQMAANRQVVTGLTVNRKVNVHADYYRYARSMCHSLFRTGSYHRPVGHAAPPESPTAILDEVNTVEGIINFIHSIRNGSDKREVQDKKGAPTATRKLYRKLLNYKNFADPEKPLIICEGKTDNIYLECAIRQLPAYKTKFLAIQNDQTTSLIRLFKYGHIAKEVMLLGGGYGDLHGLIKIYKELLDKFLFKPMKNPVIVVIDNDDGAQKIFSMLKGVFSININHQTTADYYHLVHNLYLVKTPELGQNGFSCSESLFDNSTISIKLDGKSFNPTNQPNTASEYGKHIFAEKVVRANASTINFSGFDPLLHRIAKVIEDYIPPKSGQPKI